jgi:hypothetical protein
VKMSVQRTLGAACIGFLGTTGAAIARPIEAGDFGLRSATPSVTAVRSLSRAARPFADNQGKGKGADHRCSPGREGPLCNASGTNNKDQEAVAAPDAGLVGLRRRLTS